MPPVRNVGLLGIARAVLEELPQLVYDQQDARGLAAESIEVLVRLLEEPDDGRAGSGGLPGQAFQALDDLRRPATTGHSPQRRGEAGSQRFLQRLAGAGYEHRAEAACVLREGTACPE